MPAVGYVFTEGTPATTSSSSFVDASCTSSALTNAVDYLVIASANFRFDDAGGGATGDWPELELRHGTTRLAVSRWQHIYGQYNSGDSAAGGCLSAAAVVTGDGSSTINMRFRSLGGTYVTRVGGQSSLAIALDQLTANTDYWTADSASGETAEYSTANDTTLQLRCVMVDAGTTVLGPEEPIIIRPGARDPDGICGSFVIMDVRSLTASTAYTFRWEIDDSGWQQGDAAGQVSFTCGESGSYLIVASCEASGTGTVFDLRRTRVHVFRLAAFGDSLSITNGGNINTGTAGETEAANSLTHDFGTSVSVITLGSWTHQGDTNWSSSWLRRQGSPDVNYPNDDGLFFNYPTASAVGSSTDWATVNAISAATISGSTSWTIVGQVDSGGNIAVGRNQANSASSRAVIVSILAETASGTTHNGSGTSTSTIGVLAAATVTRAGAASSSAAVGVTAAATVTRAGAATSTAAIGVTASATVDRAGSAASSTAIGVTAAATVTRAGAATSSTAVGVTAAATVDRAGAATSTTAVGVTAAATRLLYGHADVVATIGVTATPAGALSGDAASSTSVTVSAAATVTRAGAATSTTAVGVTADGRRQANGTAASTAAVGVSAAATVTRAGAANSTNVVSLSATAVRTIAAAAAIAVTVSGSAAGTVSAAGYHASGGNASAAFVGERVSCSLESQDLSCALLGAVSVTRL